MGRPSKLTEVQWEKLHKRLLGGETLTSLSKEFGISKPQIYAKFPNGIGNLKLLAQQIVTVDEKFNNLTASEQRVVNSFADTLKAIAINSGIAAGNNMQVSREISEISVLQLAKINRNNPMESQEALQAISALTKISNDSASMGLSLLNANKETGKQKDANQEPVSLKIYLPDNQRG